MNTFIGEIIGIICCTCTTIAFLPQAIKSIRTKDVSGLSLTMYIIYCSGLVFWILYGIYLKSLQMIVSDSITLLFSSIILFMVIKARYKNK